MVIDHNAKTEEEFKDSASPLLLDIMRCLQAHNPDVITTAQILAELLAGCLVQLDKTDRDKLRGLIITCLEEADSPDSNYVDFTDRLRVN